MCLIAPAPASVPASVPPLDVPDEDPPLDDPLDDPPPDDPPLDDAPVESGPPSWLVEFELEEQPHKDADDHSAAVAVASNTPVRMRMGRYPPRLQVQGGGGATVKRL
jgi:hypothetical protein